MVGACANICHNQWGSATEATDNPESSFIECLGERDAAVLRSLAARRRYPAGATLFFEADPAHDVIVVERGEVSILVTAIDGRELVIDVFGPGSLLGELSAIDGASRSASAVAIGDVEVIAVPTARFSEFLDAHPRAQRVLAIRNAADMPCPVTSPITIPHRPSGRSNQL